MSLTLYRKYRPNNFEEIVGQKYIKIALKNALNSNKLTHAYLFDGPRGVGKTTIARILSKGINCINNGISDNPCNICDNCIDINNTNSLDVIEIDAASNRGINEIRELKENINYLPVNSKMKIYIIDEVHMLTKEAFNALLKTLEEPPKHIMFILATTELDKIPDTIISRCQRYDFQMISKDEIIELLDKITNKEGKKIDKDSLELIFRKSEGSARDSMSILEQVLSSIEDENIDIRTTENILGVIPNELLSNFDNIIKNKNKKEFIKFINHIWEKGLQIELLLKDYCYYIKDNENIEQSIFLISNIYEVLNKFRYEEDKRLIGYVLAHKLFNKNIEIQKEEKEEIFENEEIERYKKDANKNDNKENDKIILSKWNDFIKNLSKNGELAISAILTDAQFNKYENDIIYISINNEFHYDYINEYQKILLINKELKSFYNKELSISFINKTNSKNNKEEGYKKIQNKVKKLFDAKIIN